jgi:hypothetical protein
MKRHIHWGSSQTPSEVAIQGTASNGVLSVAILDIVSFICYKNINKKTMNKFKIHTQDNSPEPDMEQRSL